jgi:hypothetical protein
MYFRLMNYLLFYQLKTHPSTGLQQPHHNPNAVDRLFGGIPSHMGPLPHFNQKKPFSVSEGFYSGYDTAPPTAPPQFGDIRLHDPSIVSTSPQDLRRVNSSPGAPQQSSLDMSSLQQGLQELFPNANISFSGQRVRQAPPGFQNVTPNHTNLLLCQQLQNEHKVIKIQ